MASPTPRPLLLLPLPLARGFGGGFFGGCRLQFAGMGEGGGQVLAGEGGRVFGHLLRRAGRDDQAAAGTALGAEVDDIIGPLDDIEVVLDDDDGVAGIDELVQHLDQPVHVGDVQAGRRLVENIDGLSGVPPGQLVRELDQLRLAARKSRRGLAKLDIPSCKVCSLRAILGWLAKNTQASSTVMFKTSEIFLSR